MTRPESRSAAIASRRVLRLTPSRSASSRSGGSCSPSVKTPSRMAVASCSTVASKALPDAGRSTTCGSDVLLRRRSPSDPIPHARPRQWSGNRTIYVVRPRGRACGPPGRTARADRHRAPGSRSPARSISSRCRPRASPRRRCPSRPVADQGQPDRRPRPWRPTPHWSPARPAHRRAAPAHHPTGMPRGRRPRTTRPAASGAQLARPRRPPGRGSRCRSRSLQAKVSPAATGPVSVVSSRAKAR